MYWGEGWEDPVSKQLVNRALRVVSNDSSIPMEELTDFFDWLYFEEDGGVGKVKGNEGYEASSLQSWVPRHGQCATLAVPSGCAWWLWAVRHSQWERAGHRAPRHCPGCSS